MAEEPTSTDLHERFDAIMASADLADLRRDLERSEEEPRFEVACHTGSWSAPGSDAPILARLSGMALALADTPHGVDVRNRVDRLLGGGFPPLQGAELLAGLAPVLWFLDRASEGGLRTTRAGHLEPAAVTAACEVLPGRRPWFGQTTNRESSVPELRRFRDALGAAGLLEARGRKLLHTTLGEDLRRDPWELFGYLSSVLVPQDSPFGRDAALLLLLVTGTSGEVPALGPVAELLGLMGWRVGRDSIYDGDLLGLPLVSILGNLGPAAAPLAREALVSWHLER